MDVLRILPPPLPADWPFPPRSAWGEVQVREGVTVPGLGPGWAVAGRPGLDLGGAHAGLGEAYGRGGIFTLGAVVVRPYRRGGLLRHFTARTYASPRRFQQELGVHGALWEAGFPTVEPLGCAWRRQGLGVEGLLFTRRARGEPWPRNWSAAALDPLQAALRALCAWGLHAPDLNATNVLITPAGGVLLLDWDRARFADGAGLMGRYRSRLLRSLVKLNAPESVRASVATWD